MKIERKTKKILVHILIAPYFDELGW